jgi:hypothetical protein
LNQKKSEIQEHKIDKIIVQKTEVEKTIQSKISEENPSDVNSENSKKDTIVKPKEATIVAKKQDNTQNDSIQNDLVLPKLEVVVIKDVRMRLRLNSGKTEIFDLKPGNYSYDVQEKAEILLFNAAAVEMVFAGRKLGSLGREGRIRKLVFRAQKQNLPSEN